MSTKTIPQHDITAWLILHLAPRFGARRLQKCLQYFSSPQQICQLHASKLRHLGLHETTITAIQQPNPQKISAILTWAEQSNHHLLTLTDPRYPTLLREISDPPFLLYVDGSVKHLQYPQLAIVGSRKPSSLGLSVARHFSHGLCQAGLVVTSGLAIGIDGACHQAAIDGQFPTLAVLGSGINVIYPRQNQKLAAKIRERGAIISEFPLNSQPRAAYFPQRNRIISGLSRGTLVIEAALKSGSLITARFAAEQGREVFAVPGSIANPMTTGCHYLIQQGAKLTTSVMDILSEFPASIDNAMSPSPPLTPCTTTTLDKDHQMLVECIGFDVLKFEQLVDRSQFSTQKVSIMLCNLLLNGYIKEDLGGYSRIIL